MTGTASCIKGTMEENWRSMISIFSIPIELSVMPESALKPSLTKRYRYSSKRACEMALDPFFSSRFKMENGKLVDF